MDVVVTVPKRQWRAWLAEGALPEGMDPGFAYYFWIGRAIPKIQPGERVYIVAHGRLRGYAPLVEIKTGIAGTALVRYAGAVAVTIHETILGFRGFRYRWWDREKEQPFPEWQWKEVA